MAEKRPTRGTRFPADLDERFQEYRDERDITNSDALRKLVRSGLDAEEQSQNTTDSTPLLDALTKPILAVVAAALFGAAMLVFGLVPLFSTGTAVTLVLAVVGGGLHFASLALGTVVLLARYVRSSTSIETEPAAERQEVQA